VTVEGVNRKAFDSINDQLGWPAAPLNNKAAQGPATN